MGQGFWGGVPPAAPATPAAVENSMGAFPRRHWLFLPLWKTQWGLSPGGTGYPCRCGARGGVLFWSPVAPAFSFVFAPYPPDPRSQSALPRRGRGRPKLFFARGSAPCIPSIRPPAALARPAVSAPSGAGAVSCRACFACRINAFLPPIPPTRARRALFPGGEGGDQSYFMQGASPLASPALDRLRHLLALPLWKTQWRLSPGGTCSTCPGGEDHLKRRRRVSDG